MWLWHKFTGFFQTWYGSVAGAIDILATIYNGVPQMFKTWDFLIDRFRDQPVLEVLHEVRLPKKLAPFNPTGPGQISPTIKSIILVERSVVGFLVISCGFVDRSDVHLQLQLSGLREGVKPCEHQPKTTTRWSPVTLLGSGF